MQSKEMMKKKMRPTGNHLRDQDDFELISSSLSQILGLLTRSSVEGWRVVGGCSNTVCMQIPFNNIFVNVCGSIVKNIIAHPFYKPQIRMTSAATCSHGVRKELLIPDGVSGMTELDRERFRTNVVFPVVEIDARDCTAIRTKIKLEKYLLRNLLNVKNVMDHGEDRLKKLLVFDPAAVTEEDKTTISTQISELTGKEAKFSEKNIELKYENWDLRRCIRAILPEGLDFSSFTQAGHLVHCNFREELSPYKKVLAEVLADKVSKCTTVVNKLDGISSTYRNFELELLAGEANYEVEVLEGGLKYKLDFSKVFWNTRLGHEHDRVLKLIDSRALVYDACAGVGPFALPAAKKKAARKVLANDLNPDSVMWMKKNVEYNKVRNDAITLFNMDAVEFIRGPVAEDLMKEISMCADPEWTPPSRAHVLMNLPAYAVNFLPAFRGMLHGKTDITELPFKITVYCYLFAKAHEDVPDSWFKEKAGEMVKEKLEWEEAEITYAHHVRTVSSRKEMYCMQIDLPLGLLVAEPVTPKEDTVVCNENTVISNKEDTVGNGIQQDKGLEPPPEKKQRVN